MANDMDIQTAPLDAETLGVINELSLAGLGGAGAALGGLLNQEVKLSSPHVQAISSASLPEPFAGEKAVLLTIQHTQGLNNATAYALRELDAKLIAALMMAGSADNLSAEPLDDLESGAVIEAFSQVHGAVSSSIGELLSQSIDANMPELVPFTAAALSESLKVDELVSITFSATLGGGQILEVTQYIPADGARHMAALLLGDESLAGGIPSVQPNPPEARMSDTSVSNPTASKSVDPVTVRPVEFSSFDQQHQVYGEENKNLELVMDVTLSLTVELGRTQLSIKDVLELTRGSVIELDRVAGEPVDLLANGKLIAKGEVVVIEDNFGLRITSIVSPADRLRGM